MLVELTNHYVEMSKVYEVKDVKEETYGNKTYFTFCFNSGERSKEYSTPTYSYRII